MCMRSIRLHGFCEGQCARIVMTCTKVLLTSCFKGRLNSLTRNAWRSLKSWQGKQGALTTKELCLLFKQVLWLSIALLFEAYVTEAIWQRLADKSLFEFLSQPLHVKYVNVKVRIFHVKFFRLLIQMWCHRYRWAQIVSQAYWWGGRYWNNSLYFNAALSRFSDTKHHRRNDLDCQQTQVIFPVLHMNIRCVTRPMK